MATDNCTAPYMTTENFTATHITADKYTLHITTKINNVKKFSSIKKLF